MANNSYARFEKHDLILRDELAIDRTLLANERTLLAYLRSAVALVIAGVSIMHFSEHVWFYAVGIICIPTGIVAGVVGVARFRRMDRSIAVVRRSPRTEETVDTAGGRSTGAEKRAAETQD